jgi:hypothetical protein
MVLKHGRARDKTRIAIKSNVDDEQSGVDKWTIRLVDIPELLRLKRRIRPS